MKNNSNSDDFLLIKKAQNGHEGAFNFLMTKYYPRVYASLYSYTKSREDSEDLTQQTFVKVWQQIKTFRGDSAFFTWVYRIAINLAKNHFASSSSKKDKLNISSSDIDICLGGVSDERIATILARATEHPELDGGRIVEREAGHKHLLADASPSANLAEVSRMLRGAGSRLKRGATSDG